jgi:hypothetical protein
MTTEAQRGRVWLVVLAGVAAAAGAIWHFWPEEVGRAVRQAEKALDPGPTITPIRDVVAAPARFQGKEVTIQGTVTSTSELVMAGQASRFYTLKSEGAELVVTVREGLPARGQALVVTGVVSEAPRGSKGLAPRLAEKRRERAQ